MVERITGDIRKYMDKSYLGSWDVPDGDDLVLTIDYVTYEEMQNNNGKKAKPVLHFRERGYKPMVCNATNAERIATAYKDQRSGKLCYDADKWIGKKVAVYTEVGMAFGKQSEYLRIRDTPPRPMVEYCEECGEQIKDAEVGGKMRRAKAIAESTRSRFGRCLCAECASKEAADV